MTPADPTLNALLAATATEDWPAWYGCTRLALADYLEDRDLPGDRQGAKLVRRVEPTAWAQCPVRPGWEVDEVRLARAGGPARWRPYDASKLVAVAGYGLDDGAWSRLAGRHLWPGTPETIGGHFLRPFPLRALRLSAVIPDESEVSAGVTLRPVGWTPPDYSRRWYDLKLTPRDARLWCRREVLGLFADVLVKAPCPLCSGTGEEYLPRDLHPLPCRRCQGWRPRPRPAPSLLPALPAVALPALAPVN